jgi:hypothetical protein
LPAASPAAGDWWSRQHFPTTAEHLVESELASAGIADRLTAAEANAAVWTARAERADRNLSEAQRTVDDLAAAVVRVASHITEETCACPVCASVFPG